ncbi:flagellar hook assembly protein FlgD [Paenibacillus allorhizosphaerae]|uniref:Flagellar hook capping protein n=1 Tax=Paenibacillus allorhizosphaerae TaxID=2849866 RepID=A0ABM8VCC1_9BACL|nr:flagellar hook assembly protein FlgD [Paenibacillus allorhizosphaerae]CAG7623579.1 hypothetical protein PAECIP111802_00962 [Paenibacillus allorhizosphaerae]
MADSIISTKNVWPYYDKSNVQRAANGKTNELGKDQFLKILMTQMQNQDPTQPLQDKEFIAQMAQFTSVEQLTNMNAEMKLLRQSLGFASGLIGKNVTWSEKDDATTQSGIVESIVMKNGEQLVKIGAEEVPLSKISEISNPEASQ